MSRPLKVLIIGDGDAGKTSLRSRYLSNQFKPAYRATIGADFVSKTIEVSVPVPRESRRRKRRLSKASSSSSSCHSSCDENEEGNTHQKDDLKSSVVKGKNKAEQQKDGKTARPHPKRSCSSELAAATAARHQEKVRVTLSIWDTAGQERFRSLGTAFYRGADAVIIAFDITKKGSLARTLQWYRDFCAMGDLGDEVELGLTPKQIRLAKQQKERFCWVAVGCKGDLLTKLNEQKDKQNVQGISWQSARNWFDEMQPRYLPITQSETNAFADVDPASHAVRKARPYAIHDEIPADPEDVLSRPSPKNQPSFSLSNESTNISIDARHPQAGTPPGEAIAPGQDANLREQPTLEAHGRLNNQGLNSIDLWEGGLSTSNSSSNGGGQDEGVVTNNGYERSRYDSTTSQSGNSVYYSVRGSTIVSQSPTIRTSDSPNRLANGTLPSTVRSNGVNGISQPRAESPSSHFSGKDISNRSRKQSNLSSLNTSSEDDETETEPRNTSRPPLDKSESEQSVLTERGVTSKESEGNGTNKEDEEEKGGENATIAISSIPSGDPIPFPTEDEVKDENDLQEIRARRRKRLSRLSQKRQSIASLSAVEANEALIIAETTKEQREEEEQEIHEVEEEEEEHVKRQAKRTYENHLDNRMTLYSARPSSTTSTIRPADGDISQDDENSNTKLHPPKNGQNERTANSSLVVLDVESDDDESDADSNLYEDHIEQGFRLFYTSAKNGTSIDDVFQHIAYRVALRWTYEEWEEAQRRQAWGYGPEGEVRTAPPTNEEIERERVKRAIKISQGKGTGGCCSG